MSEAASRVERVAGVQGPTKDDRRLQRHVPTAGDDGQ